MYSKSKKSSAKGLDRTLRQEKYHDRVSKLGCVITGDKYHVTLHHIHGAKTELKNDVGASIHIGEDAVLPLHPIVHLEWYGSIAIKNGLYNLDAHRKEFEQEYGTELELFEKMIDKYNQEYPDCEHIDHEKIQLIIDRGLIKQS